MTQITPIPINQLPAATMLTGNEAVPIYQNGTTVQTPINAMPQGMSAGVVTYGVSGGAPFPNYRTLAAGSGITFTDGGAQANLVISANSSFAIPPLRIVTASGDYTVQSDDYTIVIMKTVGEPTNVILPACVLNRRLEIIDGNGDAGTNPITLVPNGSNTVIGQASFFIDANYGGLDLLSLSTKWIFT